MLLMFRRRKKVSPPDSFINTISTPSEVILLSDSGFYPVANGKNRWTVGDVYAIGQKVGKVENV